MKQVTAALEFKIDKKLWEKFVSRLLQLSRREFASLKVATDFGSITIRQVSPVPRMQRTIISYRDDGDHVVVEQVTLESAEGLRIPSHEELTEDVVHFIESFLD